MLRSPNEPQPVILDLIRHGEPEGGVRYRGSIDDPLSKTGWHQMQHATGQALAHGTQWDAVVSSPMLRCCRFGEAISEQQALPFAILPDLRELSFGDLEGMTPKDAWAQHPEILQAMWQDPEANTPPGGEAYRPFLERVGASLDEVIQRYPGQRVLLTVHGGVIRAALTHLLHISPRDSFAIEVPYAGMTRIKIYPNIDGSYQAGLVFLNRFTGDS